MVGRPATHVERTVLRLILSEIDWLAEWLATLRPAHAAVMEPGGPGDGPGDVVAAQAAGRRDSATIGGADPRPGRRAVVPPRCARDPRRHRCPLQVRLHRRRRARRRAVLDLARAADRLPRVPAGPAGRGLRAPRPHLR